MNAKALAILTALLLPSGVLAQDPVQTDGDKYKVLLENDQVRVLEYTDQPGQRTQQHRHPAFVLYALAPFRRTLTLVDGRVVSREFKAGDVMFSNGETHIGTNAGSTATRVLMIELKGARP
jgi:quercetin dioxygenase-like cupin family protein